MMHRGGEGGLRDHDFFETGEGWIFCVLGDVHPPGRVWSFLKYVPGEGPWRRGATSYRRAMSIYSVDELIEVMRFIRERRPDYILIDETVSAPVMAPPISEIARLHRARERMREILSAGRLDRLESRAAGLAARLAEASGVETSEMGVSGSLLVGIHHEGSDIDLLVYGRENYWRVQEAILSQGDRLGVRRLAEADPRGWIERAAKKYPLQRREIEALARRVVNKGVFGDVWFSVHALREEPEYRYGEVWFRSLGHVETVLEITSAVDSTCTPSIYEVSKDNELGVERITSYDMMLAGLFRPGDVVEVSGKLEAIVRDGRERGRQVLIGSYEGRGREYIRLLESS